MARLNIETSLWADPRFQELLVRVGNRHTAKGMVVELWAEAQRFWLSSGGRGIPRPAWEKSGLPVELIKCGLAEDRGEFIYASGSRDAFNWLKQRSAAGKAGGKESGKSRLKRKGKAPTRDEAEESGAKHPSLPLTHSLPLSSDFISSSDTEIYSVGEGCEAPSSEIRSPVGFFIGRYVAAYRKRYGDRAKPSLVGKVQGQVRRYLAETSLERACAMIETYCRMNDTWFLTKGHDFGTFLENLAKVGLALDTGAALTRGEIRQIDRKQTTLNAFMPLIAEAQAKEAGSG